VKTGTTPKAPEYFPVQVEKLLTFHVVTGCDSYLTSVVMGRKQPGRRSNIMLIWLALAKAFY